MIGRFRAILKECIQTDKRTYRPWKPVLTEDRVFLHNYCATPHATTGATSWHENNRRAGRTLTESVHVPRK